MAAAHGHGVYVHVPWCRIRCPYCAFVVVPDRPGTTRPDGAFVDALLAEHAAHEPAFGGPRHTVYLGGGTPSRLGPEALATVLDTLVRPETREVTVEANPEDLTEAWLDHALAHGMTRVSLGVQTLAPHHARRLGRAHTPDDAHKALRRVTAAPLKSWTADLMFGLPDQTLDDLKADLDALLAWRPPHVSVYGLTIEPGTPYARAQARDRLTPADDSTWRAMYDHLVDTLQAAGLARYEVSNFARPGHEAEHNRGYWTHRPYLGLGPGAHSFAPDGRRWQGTSDVDAYVHQTAPPPEVQPYDPLEAAIEALVSGLRGRNGLDLAALADRTGWCPDRAVRARLVRGGVLLDDALGCRLSHAGFPVADAIVRALVDALEPTAP